MASVTNRPNGHKWIQFTDGAGKRQTVRLGKRTVKAANEIKTKIEALNCAAVARLSWDRETAEWVGGIGLALRDKLAAVGLVPKRQDDAPATLESFIDAYIAGRTDVKPATKEVWRQGKNGLVAYFGANRLLREVTQGDADGYKLKLIGDKLATMTVRKRLQFAKMIFRAAVRRRLISSDPFADVNVQASMPDRRRFITQDEATKILAACPDHHWRLIVALARYGGLRCPSEVLSLRWQDVDWESSRIVVQSPKTEHHPGKATRTIPLFDELHDHLQTSFELAPEGAVYVIDERFRRSAMGKSGWRNCNLRTTFEKIVRRAGLEPWPRLFHNLRSTRQTELAEDFPSHVCCAWLGNSEDVARQHYLQVTDEHFKAATAERRRRQPATGAPVNKTEAKQNPKQHNAATTATDSHRQTGDRDFSKEIDNPRKTASPLADGEGFEPTVDFRPRRFSRPVP